MPAASWRRSPYFWAAVFGLIAIPAMRPFMRHVPEPPSVVGTLPAWSLTDQDGQPFGSEQLAGQAWVAGFFFSSCVTICPRILGAMKDLRRCLDDSGATEVALVAITVDPETDSPERLRAYQQEIEADGAGWHFLTGTRPELEAVVVGGFKTLMGTPEEIGDDLIDIGHGARLIIVDPDGGVRGHYDVTTPEATRPIGTWTRGVDEICHRVRHVLRAR